MRPLPWRIDVHLWPGPDRAKWGIDRDLVVPSPDGRLAAVLYSCTEIRVMCDVGLFTLLEGPPHNPGVLVQPPNCTCLDFSPAASIQWLAGSRYVAVTAYLYRPVRNVVDLLALAFFDTEAGTFAYRSTSLELAGRAIVETAGEWVVPGRATDGARSAGPALRIAPTTLAWKPWSLCGIR